MTWHLRKAHNSKSSPRKIALLLMKSTRYFLWFHMSMLEVTILISKFEQFSHKQELCQVTAQTSKDVMTFFPAKNPK